MAGNDRVISDRKSKEPGSGMNLIPVPHDRLRMESCGIGLSGPVLSLSLHFCTTPE